MKDSLESEIPSSVILAFTLGMVVMVTALMAFGV